MRQLAICGLLLAASTTGLGGEADVVDASVECDSSRRCTFHVTVRHADAGWDHYANHWRILGPGGVELGRRVLLHPHEQEQPFTRSLAGVAVPDEADQVVIQAHDSVHGYGGDERLLTLP